MRMIVLRKGPLPWMTFQDGIKLQRRVSNVFRSPSVRSVGDTGDEQPFMHGGQIPLPSCSDLEVVLLFSLRRTPSATSGRPKAV